jgi:phage head maturation protease
MRIDVVAVPWDSTSRMTSSGYRERFVRDAIAADQLVGVPVIDGHTGQAVGVVEAARSIDAGLLATIRLSATQLARDLHTLATDGALGASLGFTADPDSATVDRSGIVTRTSATPRELSLTPLPAYEDARVLQTREALPMPDYTFTDPSSVTVTSDADPSTPETQDVSAAAADVVETRSAPRARAPRAHVEYASSAELEDLRSQLDAVRSLGSRPAAGHPLARFGSFAEFARAVFTGDASELEVRALSDQVPSANPGVMAPSWLTDVRGIVAKTRSLIEATGGALSPGESGLDVEWPYFDGDYSTLIGVQATPKTQITSVQVAIEKGTASLKTYSGGSDIAYQLIERSSPAYLDAYLRIMAAAYGRVTEAAFAQAAASGTAFAGATLDNLYQSVIEASALVEDATGVAPSVIGIAPDLWGKIAGAVDGDKRPLYPALGPVNAPGQINGPGATGGISIAGVRAVRAALPATKIAVLNGEAMRWLEDGPRTVQAENVALLGRDVAVYGYAAPAIFVPGGVQVMTIAPPTTR